MAKIVLGMGSSHGPTMRTPPDQWLTLGKKDAEDPRFDYAAVLRTAPPNMEAQLTSEKITERYNACQVGIRTLGETLAEAKPDTVVVISNLHGEILDYAQQPFGIYVGESIPRNERRGGTMASGEQAGRAPGGETRLPFPPLAAGPARPAWVGGARGGRPEAEAADDGADYPADSALARRLHRSLLDAGFDITCCSQFRPNSGLGDAFTSLYSLYWPAGDLPMVPFMISRYLPNEPTSARCYDLGRALRQAIDAWDIDRRVALFASGGLSHQIVDEELDRSIIEALLERDEAKLRALPRDRLNRAPGTPESLNWVTVAAAIDETPMTLVKYVPCYRSPAGTGHGVTFGYWKVSESEGTDAVSE